MNSPPSPGATSTNFTCYMTLSVWTFLALRNTNIMQDSQF